MEKLFKFQYDNTLSQIPRQIGDIVWVFKFQYDNTLRKFVDALATPTTII